MFIECQIVDMKEERRKRQMKRDLIIGSIEGFIVSLVIMGGFLGLQRKVESANIVQAESSSYSAEEICNHLGVVGNVEDEYLIETVQCIQENVPEEIWKMFVAKQGVVIVTDGAVYDKDLDTYVAGLTTAEYELFGDRVTSLQIQIDKNAISSSLTHEFAHVYDLAEDNSFDKQDVYLEFIDQYGKRIMQDRGKSEYYLQPQEFFAETLSWYLEDGTTHVVQLDSYYANMLSK